MNKRAMIRNYFRVIHITIEKIIIENTHLAQNDPGTSPESHLDFLTKTYKGPLGDFSTANKLRNNYVVFRHFLVTNKRN